MRNSSTRSIASWLWVAIPVLSVGTLAWIPTLHAAAQLRSRICAHWTLVLAAFLVPAFSITGAATPLAFAAAGGFGSVQAIRLRGIIFGEALRRSSDLDPIAAGRRQRKLRTEARRLIARDPQLARELHVGRPDIPHRRYDDGGLVDVNTTPESTLGDHLKLDTEVVERIVLVREQVGTVSSVDEFVARCMIPREVVSRIRHLAVAIP